MNRMTVTLLNFSCLLLLTPLLIGCGETEMKLTDVEEQTPAAAAPENDPNLKEAISALKSLAYSATDGGMNGSTIRKEVKRASLAAAEIKITGPKVDEVKRLVAMWEKCRRQFEKYFALDSDSERLPLMKQYGEMLEEAKAATDSAGL